MDANIIFTANAIGIATFSLVTAGVMIGPVWDIIATRRAEMMGGAERY
jgi:manganese efflux pump family protein